MTALDEKDDADRRRGISVGLASASNRTVGDVGGVQVTLKCRSCMSLKTNHTFLIVTRRLVHKAYSG